VVQPVHKNFQTALELMAFGQWLGSKREFDEARTATADGFYELEQEFKAVRKQANYSPTPFYNTGTWR